MSFVDIIDEYCKLNKMSGSAFVKAIGLSRTALTKWRNGSTPRADGAKRIADFIGITSEELLAGDISVLYRCDSSAGSDNKLPDSVRESSLSYIPVYRYLDPASPVPDPDNADNIDKHYAVLPENLKSAKHCFGYTVRDSSMAPDIEAGDTVIVQADLDPESGDIVLVNTPGEETCCRKLIKQGHYIILQPFNSHYDAQVYTPGEPDLLPVMFRGKVVAVIRAVKSSAHSVPEV